MAKIVTITNPLTGQPAQVDQLDHTAQQIDDGLNIARGVSNPNLLDNWYFANPVNQRGQTSYTDAGYTIDRWLNDNLAHVTIAENKITCGSTVANYSAFRQYIENPSQYIGKTLTFSVLAKAISGSPSTFIPYHGTAALKNELSVVSQTFVFGSTPGEDTSNLQVCIWANNSVSSFELIAAKLELGSTQTLAHQDANGNWVLNEIPDYGEQLARCQRYYFKPTVAFAGPSCMVAIVSNTLYGNTVFPVQMRTTPSIANIKLRKNSDGSVWTLTDFHMGMDGGNDGFNTIYGILGASLVTGEYYSVDYEASADL